ncbi:putative spore germination protein GerPF [[Clostridium] ultunense Esp]|uniref:spore germination protein n=1 Tax=Thermicanus aegyptius TaxID=94009 RepID=UPI0002B7070F|nr:spore germination protein [Thermicanus aegyptius]CCQ92470.1 putative spore germination protein GerPF [[Clostridium] ultunense Esp]
MPSIVGVVKVISVSSSAVVNFGDVLNMAPKSATKTYAGSGSFSTGDFPVTYNPISSTNTVDPDLFDNDTLSGN